MLGEQAKPADASVVVPAGTAAATGLNARGVWVSRPLYGQQLPGGGRQLPGSRARQRRAVPGARSCPAGAAVAAGSAAGLAEHAIPADVAVP